MFRNLIVGGLLLFASFSYAQNIAINTTGNAPHNSAMLDITANNRGLLIPRMTLAQRNNIAAPATGLLIYQTNSTPGFYYFDGTVWLHLGANNWRLTGNAGTNATTNFIGTTDNQALRIRTNNAARLEITTTGQLRAFYNGTAAAPTYSFNANPNTGIYRPAANSLGFSTSGVERVRINNNGQVLVNTLTPTDPNQFEVRVSGSAYWGVNSYNVTTLSGAGFFHNTAASGYNALESVTNGSNSGIWGWHNNTFANGYGVRGTTQNQTFAWAGFFQGDVGAVGYFNISDLRWKKNIRNMNENSILQKVMSLKPKSYQYRADEFPGLGFDSTRTVFGFIAQELAEVFPEVVTNKKGIPDPTQPSSYRQEANNVSGYYLVDYSALIPVLTKAIQEQQVLIESLFEEIQQLKSVIAE